MKKINWYSSISAGMLLTSLAWAGGVSDGGGGTTNPEPVDPYWIVRTAVDYAGPLARAWIYQEEDSFSREWDPQKSPFAPVFAAGKDFHALLKSTSIEFQMSQPCFDANGVARDGSIYASKPGAICISPFTMAQKLNQQNYNAETVALIIHELVHLLGADEAQAQQIQRQAIWSLSKMDFLDFIVTLDLLAKGSAEIGDALFELSLWMYRPETIQSREVHSLNKDLIALRKVLGIELGSHMLVRNTKLNMLTAQFTRTRIIREYLCANDVHEDPLVREDCAQELAKAFGSDAVSTARQIMQRIDDMDFGADFDQVSIRKITGRDDLVAELVALRDFLLSIQDDLKDLRNSEMHADRVR